MKNILSFCLFISFMSCAKYTSITSAGALVNLVGHDVIFLGKISELPEQHLIDYNKEYPEIYYIMIGNSQTVSYSKKPINTLKHILIKGKVIKVSSKSKNPAEVKIYTEYQILIDSWEEQP